MLRSILLFVLLFAAGTGFSQTVIDGFWGVPFGSDMQTAKALIKKDKGVDFVSDKQQTLVYEPASFGGYACEKVSLVFDKNGLIGGLVAYPVDPIEIMSTYKAIVKSISKKYGKPSIVVEKYLYPYEKNDGHEEIAIRGGYAEIKTFWNQDKPIDAFVKVSVEKDLTIQLCYASSENAGKNKEAAEKEF